MCKPSILSRGVAAASAVALFGCASPPTQEQTGMIIGGVLGGVLGAQVGEGRGRTAATIVGTIVGAAIGGAVGRSMDEQDRIKTAHTLETVRTGVPSQWRNPDTGNVYTVTPTRTIESAQGPCREYTIDAMIGGRKEQVVGTACRQPDGSWRAVS
jgi:surface antigen